MELLELNGTTWDCVMEEDVFKEGRGVTASGKGGLPNQ